MVQAERGAVMYWIEAFEALGVRAAVTEMADGDCGHGAPGRALALKAFGTDLKALAVARQVHGNRVWLMERGNATADAVLPAGDAIITNARGVVAGVTVADCVPVFLAVPGLAVGLAHSGREGTRKNIAMATVRAMCREFAVSPEVIHAFIGPGAGVCCYAVDEEMAKAWREAGGLGEGGRLDLSGTICRQLCDAGLARERIALAQVCTICTRRFFSYRRDGTAARNLALIGL
jgi:YfiH family protein